MAAASRALYMGWGGSDDQWVGGGKDMIGVGDRRLHYRAKKRKMETIPAQAGQDRATGWRGVIRKTAAVRVASSYYCTARMTVKDKRGFRSLPNIRRPY